MKDKAKTRVQNRIRKKMRIHRKVYGTTKRPRISVFRSLKHFYAQIIDDDSGRTLVSSSTLSPEIKKEIAKAKTKKEKGMIVGEYLAKKAVEKGIKEVVFDRSGYIYHGRIRAFAEGARKGGLQF